MKYILKIVIASIVSPLLLGSYMLEFAIASSALLRSIIIIPTEYHLEGAVLGLFNGRGYCHRKIGA